MVERTRPEGVATRVAPALGPLLGLFLALLAGPRPAAAQLTPGFSVGLSVGGAGIQIRRGSRPWDFGPLFGARASWVRTNNSSLSLAVDAQPFEAAGANPDDRYRALYLVPGYEVRGGRVGVSVGLGLAIARFNESIHPERTEVTTVTGVGGGVSLPAQLRLELGWRNTGNIRGARTQIWALQLVRRWRL